MNIWNHFSGKIARCIVFSQSSVPSRNSEADEPDEADEPEAVSATAAPTPPVIAPGARITVVSKQTPSNKELVFTLICGDLSDLFDVFVC